MDHSDIFYKHFYIWKSKWVNNLYPQNQLKFLLSISVVYSFLSVYVFDCDATLTPSLF